MKFMPWNKEMGITYAQYRRQVDQELNSWLAGLELSASTLEYRPGPVIRPPGLEQTGPSRPPGLHPSKPGYIQPGRPDPRSINTRPWLGIRRKQQYGYDSALKQRKNSKGKSAKKKRDDIALKTPKSTRKPRRNLLSIASTLNL